MRRVLKWIGIVVGGLIALVVLAATAGLLIGSSALTRSYTVAEEFDASGGDQANGRRLAQLNGCAGCHLENLGGGEFVNEAPLGYVAAPNLTTGEGGAAAEMTDTELEHAIRHGVHPSGRPLIIMPAGHFQHLSDQELADIIAYIRSVPPVDQSFGEPDLMVPAKLMMGLGVFPADLLLPAGMIDHEAGHLAQRPTDPVALGEHVSRICIDCHQADYGGGVNPFDPNSESVPNLTQHEDGLAGWTEAEFAAAVRTGVAPDRNLDPEKMLWPLFSQFTDEEVSAIWAYLNSLPPVPDDPVE